MFTGEVNHHGTCSVVHHVHVTLVAIGIPVAVVLRHLGIAGQALYGVDDVQVCLMLHGNALRHLTLGATGIADV